MFLRVKGSVNSPVMAMGFVSKLTSEILSVFEKKKGILLVYNVKWTFLTI